MREIIWCNEKQTLVILANFFRKYTFHILLGELSPTWDAPLSSLEMKKEHFLSSTSEHKNARYTCTNKTCRKQIDSVLLRIGSLYLT